MALRVTADFQAKIKEGYVHVEDIQDSVEKILEQSGYAEAAKALTKHFEVTLVYCFEKKGVLRDENDDESVISEITRPMFEKYVADGIIQGGMIPKLENSFDAIHAGVSRVVITKADHLGEGEGTTIHE